MDWKAAVEAIRQRAFAARLPISDLCKEANVSGNVFWRWENGHAVPSLKTIGKLEDALTRIERERAAA